MCGREMMVDIECRAADSKIPHKATGENVDCSIRNGLECRPSSGGSKKGGSKGSSLCLDYEIRILCQCGNYILHTEIPEFRNSGLAVHSIHCRSVTNFK